MICQKLAEVKSDILKFYFVFDTNRVKRKGLAMKNILFTLCFCLLAIQAQATVRCSEDSFGNRNCYGTNSDGEYVHTRSRTDSFGNTNTYGTIGNKNVNTRSRTDSFGNTNTYGTIGNRNIHTRSRKDSFGNTNYYDY